MSLDPRILVALAALAALVPAACRPAADETAPQPSATKQVRPMLPVVEPPLDREAVLLAIARAASAAASGVDDTEAQRLLDGRRFEMKLRFGCGGPEAGPRRWSFEESERILRIDVQPDLAFASLPFAELGLTGVEAAEGFWINRPWLLTATCPAVKPQPSQPAPSGSSNPDPAESAVLEAPSEPDSAGAIAPPRIAIAQFFAASDSRLRRRDRRAYSATVTLPPDEPPSTQGYDLVITGRAVHLPSGRVITCRPMHPDRPPDCVMAVAFDVVRVQYPGNGRVLAEWSGA